MMSNLNIAREKNFTCVCVLVALEAIHSSRLLCAPTCGQEFHSSNQYTIFSLWTNLFCTSMCHCYVALSMDYFKSSCSQLSSDINSSFVMQSCENKMRLYSDSSVFCREKNNVFDPEITTNDLNFEFKC